MDSYKPWHGGNRLDRRSAVRCVRLDHLVSLQNRITANRDVIHLTLASKERLAWTTGIKGIADVGSQAHADKPLFRPAAEAWK